MRVKIKNLGVQPQIKKKGIEFGISDAVGRHLGDLVINQRHLIWCKGKTSSSRGKKVTWDSFIANMENRFKSQGVSRNRKIRQLGKRIMNAKEWSAAEIKKLRAGYKIKSASRLAKELRRSFPSVRGKIMALKLKKHR
ncbi:conserved hypothetical protein [Candidatus Zixiibacteriota bacterium]|nr:conserved hypothetical protein [candidate division Zixibacteria bacterium]